MHRERIIAEAKRRLIAKFPEARFVEEQSYDKAKMPSFTIWEDTEASEKHRNESKKKYRIYKRKLPLEIEYCFQESVTADQKKNGRLKLQGMREAIEPSPAPGEDPDFWFKESTTGEKLVIDYEENAADIALIYTPIVVVVVRYIFEYADAT